MFGRVIDSFKDRPTSDLLVVFMAGLVGFYVVVSLLFVIVAEFIHPSPDLALVINRVGAIVNSILGAVIGFIGGRATGQAEVLKNQQNKEKPDDGSSEPA